MTPYQEHVAKWKDCTRCHLHEGRSKVVFARGKLPCDVLFIGEAPGESEDVLGSPFVGPAGQLLDGIIASVDMEYSRCGCGSDKGYGMKLSTAFANLVGCVPRDAATGLKTGAPDSPAIKACSGKLFELVRIAKPKLIVCVGTLAKRNVYGQAQFCTPRENGQPPWIPDCQFMKFCEIVHPSFILSKMNSMQQRAAVQRCVVTLSSAVEEL